MSEIRDVEVTEYFVEEDAKGNLIIDKETARLIENFKAEFITEECPACDGDGHIGGEYCPVCENGTVSYRTELRITPISKKDKFLMDINKLPEEEKIEKAKKNGFIILDGSDESWENIPQEIKAISRDSRGKIEFYSGVSGIYERYDDEHSENKKIRSQYWYYGTALKGLNITKKYNNLNVVVLSQKHIKIYYRNNCDRIVLDFKSKKGFDWSIFPNSVTKLFVVFGGMNIRDQEISIQVTNSQGYLRDDNVCYGTESRDAKEMNLVKYWIDDDTNEYPIRTSGSAWGATKGNNEMNIHFKNIPLKTVVYELPKDRSIKVPVSKLKLLYVDLCDKINKTPRPISDGFTLPHYNFKYNDAKRREIELWILKNFFPKSYEIFDDLSIGFTGRFYIGKEFPDVIPYKMRYVDGEMFIHSKILKSTKNFPDWVDTFGFGFGPLEEIKNFKFFPKEIRSKEKIEIKYCHKLEKISGYPKGKTFSLYGYKYSDKFINFIKNNKLG